MAFGFFRPRKAALAEAGAVAVIDTTLVAAPVNQADETPAADAAQDILDLLERELAALTRQLERAATSVSNGAQSTAQTLTAIRERAGDLSGRTSVAQSTAETFSHAADEFTRSADGIGTQVRNASRLAEEAAEAAREASGIVDRLRESSAGIGNVVNLIASIARQTTMLALNSTIEAARAGEAGRGFAVVASEVKALAVQTQKATDEIRRKIDTLQDDAATSINAVCRITDAIAAIRPVFEHVSGAVADQSATTGEMTRNAMATSSFIVSVVDSASAIDEVTKVAEAHGENVAAAGQTVADYVGKLKSRCAILLQQNAKDASQANVRMPCNIAINVDGGLRPQSASIYELSRTGLLVAGTEVNALALRQVLSATIDEIGSCRITAVEQTELGAQCEFVGPDAALLDKIDDKLFALHDENAEGIARAMDAGATINRIFSDAVSRSIISADDLFDTNYVQIEHTDPPQFRTKFLTWVEDNITDIQEALLKTDSRLKFCAIVDRNGYLAMNNRYCSLPQRPGDTAWNVTNCRNRRFFTDPAGLAAAKNQRTYFVQSYPRDMGNGVKVRMREIGVPIRVGGRHWGGLRTAYTL